MRSEVLSGTQGMSEHPWECLDLNRWQVLGAIIRESGSPGAQLWMKGLNENQAAFPFLAVHKRPLTEKAPGPWLVLCLLN